MKTCLFFTIFLFCCSFTIAQTTISGGSISTTTWTISGSPYTIQGPITVTAGNTLTIEPGVELLFEPEANININGQLVAAGTAAQPIIFQATDTSGWSDVSTTTGGWSGIHYHVYNDATPDLSVFDHCIVRDVKYGFSGAVGYVNALSVERAFTIRNSIFEHYNSGSSGSVGNATVTLTSYGLDDFLFENCIIRDNHSTFGSLSVTNFNGGTAVIRNNEIFGNTGGVGIFSFGNNGTLIENNEIHDNTYGESSCPVKMTIGEATIRGNHVHHNYSQDLAAISCKSGYITIENNFIHNNYQADAFCGATSGGGGIHLAFNEGSASSFNTTYYTVRNNVIANNYSSFAGGGIYVYNTRATISNNHIINNDCGEVRGKSIEFWNPATELLLKNNLIYTRLPNGSLDTHPVVYGSSAHTIGMDHNYIPTGFSQALITLGGYQLIGDTLQNVIGTQAMLVAPTLNNDYLTDATGADFQLQTGSPCINAGDTTGASAAQTDYLGNTRLVGPIDIGAFEYREKLGISEGKEIPFLVYPNPVRTGDKIRIETVGAGGNLVLRDISGKIAYVTGVFSTVTEIPVSSLSAGTYILIYNSENGAQAVRKIVVE